MRSTRATFRPISWLLAAALTVGAVSSMSAGAYAAEDGHITGIVTGTVEGAADAVLEGIGVTAFRDDGDGNGWVVVGYTSTDADGHYDIGGPPADAYRLQFNDDTGAGYVTEFYDNATSLDTATDIAVVAGLDTAANAQLTTLGHIAGTVTGTVPGGDDVPLAGVQVIAFQFDGDNWADVRYADTDDQGHYDLGDLTPGTYRVRYDDLNDDETGYIQEFYDDATTVETGQNVAVTMGHTTPGINAQLTTLGQITGTITGTVPGSDDVALGDIGVTAFRNDGDGWTEVKYTTTDDQGDYDMAGLTPGTYRLQFDDADDSETGYALEFYNDVPTLDDADGIDVATGTIVDHINAQLTTLSQTTGHIAGTVTGTVDGGDDVPLAGVQVIAFQFDGDNWVDVKYADTDDQGHYDLAGLTPGTYRIRYDDLNDDETGYILESYDDATTVETGQDVDVTAGQTTNGINAQLTTLGQIAGTITGTVPGADDIDLAEVGIIAFRDDGDGWTEVKYTTTDDQGHYDLAGLTPGTYRLQFEDSDNTELGYIEEFFDDAGTVQAARDIEIDTGDTITGINAQLTTYGQITGTVTGAVPGADDIELADLGVTAFRDDGDGWTEVKYTTTDDQGRYDMAGLTPGAYRLQFDDADDSDSGYALEFYDNSTTVGAARDIDVGTGQIASDVDARLAPLPAITNTAAPTITGMARVGSTLTATTGTWDPTTDLTYGYRWLADGTPITGATDPTYDPTSDDIGDGITVEVTVSRDGYLSATEISGATAPVTAAPAPPTPPTPAITNSSAPLLTGTAQVGSTLTATTGTWDPTTDLTYSYRWLADGTPITGATDPTYDPTSDDIGDTITVEVTASRDGYTSATAASAATETVTAARVPAITSTEAPTITGRTRVGSTLAATTGAWDPTTDLTYSYRWLADGTPIAGATDPTYTLTPGDLDRAVRVEITASATGYSSATARSDLVTVDKGVLRMIVKPDVSGTVEKGAVLQVSRGVWSPAKVELSYRWFAGGKAIPRAHHHKLRLAGKTARFAKGEKIKVRVTASAAGYTTVTTEIWVHGRLERRTSSAPAATPAVLTIHWAMSDATFP